MVKRIEKSILIDKSPLEVFSYISNLENLPNFSNISSIEKVSGDGGIGSIYSMSTKTLLSKRSAKIVVTKNTKPNIFAYKDTSQIYDNEAGFELKNESSGTSVTAYIQVDISALGSIFGGINKNSEIEMENMLYKLKEQVEIIPPEIPSTKPLLVDPEADVEVKNPFDLTPEQITDKFKKSNY